MGGSVRHASGFTIVETLIVLAVTGLLFVVIAASLSGRQNAAEFTHAVQSIQSQVQQIIDQVSAGFYPNQGSFSCDGSTGTVQISGIAAQQGTNATCVFLGKLLQFDVQSTDPEQYEVYTVAGVRGQGAAANEPFLNVNSTVVGVNYGGSDAGLTPYATAGYLQYGLTTRWIRSDNNSGCLAPACSIGAVAFLMEPGTLDAATGNYTSGAQQVDLIPIDSTSNPALARSKLGQTLHDAANTANKSLDMADLATSAPINPTSGVEVCLVSGGTNQSAILSIGGSGRQLVVGLDIKGNNLCM